MGEEGRVGVRVAGILKGETDGISIRRLIVHSAAG
jgi:hypothetical protein